MREESAWPDVPGQPIYEGTWWLETVFTEEGHRGKGVATALLRACMDEGRAHSITTGGTPPRAGILCAIGNDIALRVYRKLGLSEVGRMVHGDCQGILQCPGFHILTMCYSR